MFKYRRKRRMSLYFINDYSCQRALIVVLCFGLTIIFHEYGHIYWDRLVTQVPSKFVITKINNHWAFGARATLPPHLYCEVKNNPTKYIRDRRLSKFAGIMGIIPSSTFYFWFPKYDLEFSFITLFMVAYTVWETFYYQKEEPWILFVNNIECKPVSEEKEEMTESACC